MNLEEKWWIVRFNRGHVDAVHMIYERTKGDLMALAVSLLRHTAAAGFRCPAGWQRNSVAVATICLAVAAWPPSR